MIMQDKLHLGVPNVQFSVLGSRPNMMRRLRLRERNRSDAAAHRLDVVMVIRAPATDGCVSTAAPYLKGVRSWPDRCERVNGSRVAL